MVENLETLYFQGLDRLTATANIEEIFEEKQKILLQFKK